MDLILLVEQLSVAVLASTVAVAAVQKIKPAFPPKWVAVLSMLVTFIIGFWFAFYYRGYDLIACTVVAFFTAIGADSLYQAFADKLRSYSEMKAIAQAPAESDIDQEG
jgi:hypothetical protein